MIFPEISQPDYRKPNHFRQLQGRTFFEPALQLIFLFLNPRYLSDPYKTPGHSKLVSLKQKKAHIFLHFAILLSKVTIIVFLHARYKLLLATNQPPFCGTCRHFHIYPLIYELLL